MRTSHLIIAAAAAALAVPAVATAQAAPPVEHVDRSYYWTEAGADTLSRERWLEHAIHAAMDRGDLQGNDGRRALAQLAVIQRDDVAQREAATHPGDRVANSEDIQARLDTLADTVKVAIYRHPM
ncbi:MAG TPA: hypothetical protein VG407_02265 [Caulobacteraceae bacterium]|jgi:hypothetical protein|nr:hypothetical protein [Caulobacteraceae bacterium]